MQKSDPRQIPCVQRANRENRNIDFRFVDVGGSPLDSTNRSDLSFTIGRVQLTQPNEREREHVMGFMREEQRDSLSNIGFGLTVRILYEVVFSCALVNPFNPLIR